MGGIIATGGAKIASALSEIEQQKSARKTYRSLVNEANKQAQIATLQGEQEEQNLLRSTAEQRREQYQKYREQQQAQQAAFAAAGLDTQSASVGQLLQSQQLQEQLNQKANTANFNQALEETRQKTAEQIRALQTKVQTSRENYRQAKKGWKLGSKFISFFSRG